MPHTPLQTTLRRPAALIATLFIAALPCSTLAQEYRITEIETLGGDESAAFDLNAAAQVVGRAYAADGWPHAFLWTLKNGTMDLGLLKGGLFAEAAGINALGHVVGSADSGVGNHAFRWDGVGPMQDLGVIAGDASGAYDLNDAGVVAGWSDIGGPVHACRWNAENEPMSLGTLGGTFSEAFDINNAGQIVGWAALDGDELEHAFVWDEVGGMTDLDTLGGPYSYAHAVSERGHVAGRAGIPREEIEHPFLWMPDAGMEDLGTFGGDFGQGWGINEHDMVVGAADDADGQTHAFLWDRPRGLRNLNDLVNPGKGWELIEARAIDNFGRIVGVGRRFGEWRGFVATPSVPCGCDANCDGVLDAFDVEPFIARLLGPGGAGCSGCAGDANGDGTVDAFDIEPFVDCLLGP